MSLRAAHILPWVVGAALLAPPAQASTRYMLAIGNNVGRAHEVPLAYAERDAREFAEVFLRLGGVAPHDAVIALGQDLASIRRSLSTLRERIQSTDGANVTLMVYYSGHADAGGLHLGAETLPYDELLGLVSGTPAQVKLLFLDACRSGGLTRVKGARGPAAPFEVRVDDRLEVDGLALITSSAAGEDSHESDTLRGSFFTHHLIAGLIGAADADRNGKVTLDEAYGYAYRHTLRSSQSTSKLQHPTHRFDLKGRGVVYLTDLARDRRRSARLTLDEPGHYLLFDRDERGAVVFEITTETRGAHVVTLPGDYFVQRRDVDHYREYNVSLAAGRDTKLTGRPYRRVAYARLVRKGGGARGSVHGLTLLVGADGQRLEGLGIGRNLVLGYGLDLSFASFEVRARWGRRSSQSGLQITHDEIAAGVTARHVFDLPVVSVGLGLLAEAVNHRQRFETIGVAPPRSSWGVAFGALITAELDLPAGLTARVELSPVAHVFEGAIVEAGTDTAKATRSVVTWSALGGIGWRL